MTTCDNINADYPDEQICNDLAKCQIPDNSYDSYQEDGRYEEEDPCVEIGDSEYAAELSCREREGYDGPRCFFLGGFTMA